MLSQRVPMHFRNSTILAQVWAFSASAQKSLWFFLTVQIQPWLEVVWSTGKDTGPYFLLRTIAAGPWCTWTLQYSLLAVPQQVSTHFNKSFPSLTTWQLTTALWAATPLPRIQGTWFKLLNFFFFFFRACSRALFLHLTYFSLSWKFSGRRHMPEEVSLHDMQ